MNILIISPKENPYVLNQLKGLEFNLSTGGWIDGMIFGLQKQEDINLSILFPSDDKKIPKEGKVAETYFYKTKPIKDFRKYNREHFQVVENVIREQEPDGILIFGTEHTFQHCLIDILEQLEQLDKVVVWIQGLVSVYYKHYNACLSDKLISKYTLKELLKRKNMLYEKKTFYRRGLEEIRILNKVRHVVGRTDWDQACIQMINSKLKYHTCNEILRNIFYEKQWDIENCERYSIFVSQNTYPIKGYHQVLEAVAILKERYPEIKVYTTGRNILSKNITDQIRWSTYEKYLLYLISKYDLYDNVVFTGRLNEEEMCNRFLKSNVFVSASSIENSPNSVAEAMILGVPTISSDVGGVKNTMTHEKEGYIYQADAPYMLAYYIDKILKNKEATVEMSKKARIKGSVTHNKDDIYHNILGVLNEVIENNTQEKLVSARSSV